MRYPAILLIFLFVLLFPSQSAAMEHQMMWTHLTADDGLSQNTVVSVHKDRKGFMWFGTWDGLNKYDGYRFTMYKSNANPGDENNPLNNRVDLIREDALGFLWVKTYDDLLYRFDPSKEHYQRVSVLSKNAPEKSYDRVENVWVLSDGSVWCSLHAGGAYRIETGADGETLHLTRPFTSAIFRDMGRIHHVFLDGNACTWILAEKSLSKMPKGASEPIRVLGDSESIQGFGFESFYESDDRIFFGSSSGDLWIYDKTHQTFRQLQTPFQSSIRYILPLPDQRLAVASRYDGFVLYDPTTSQMEHFSQTEGLMANSGMIDGMHVDMNADIWLSFDAKPGVVLYRSKTKDFTHLWLATSNDNRSASQRTTFFVFEDIHGVTWVHTKEGTLFPYDRENNRLMWFHNRPGTPETLFRTNVQVAWSDPEGVLWVCSGNQGIYKFVYRSRDFRFYSMEHYISSGTPDIRALFQDQAGQYWVSSKAGELRILDKDMKSLGLLCRDGRLRDRSDQRLHVYRILQDRKGRIWLATKGQGLILANPVDQSYQTFSMRYFRHDPANLYSVSNDNIYDLYEDESGRIWLASFDGGLMMMDETTSSIRFLHHRNELSQYPMDFASKVRSIDGDGKGTIWLGTANGFLTFSSQKSHVSEIEFFYYGRNYNDRSTLYSSDVYQVRFDSSGRVWMGTFGNGLLMCDDFTLGERPELKVYNQRNGFLTDIVLSLEEDAQGNIWLASENNLIRLHPETGNTDRYNVSNGLESGDFLEASVYRTSSGYLLFGNASGFYRISPDRVKRNEFKPNIVFTRLQLYGRDVEMGDPDGPLNRHIDDCDEIVLTHKQKTFNIEFAALDFQTPQNVQYLYRLVGYENTWNNASKRRIATYTGLPKGSYVLEVRSSNSDGVWSDTTRKLKIKVLPSFWETTWAYLFYVFLGLFILGGGVYLLFFYLRLKNEVVLEQRMSEMKLRFFTDISHELRTPLTLITAPVEHILRNAEVSDEVLSQLQIVQRNTDRMMRLVNQILDFRKVQNKKLKLKVQEIAFVEAVKKTTVNFEDVAKEQGIPFEIDDQTANALVWLDMGSFDTILFNLLSNAFKFTPAGQRILVQLEATDTEAILRVCDEGVGIDPSMHLAIFDRFNSFGDSKGRKSTGIGLSLVKELVELHGAQISLESSLGHGARFEVRFQLGVAHFSKDVDFLLDDRISVPTISEGFVEGVDFEADAENKEDTQTILIVEDNEELRPFLKSVLSRKYRVADAADGQIAWEMVQSLMPDFIITDLMMPGISGKDFIKLVRNDNRTCHIPIVVLTAKVNMDTRLECLEMGADDYITKPFSATFLEARVANIIEQRVRLQSLQRGRLLESDKLEVEVPMPQAHSRDEEFMERLMEVMEKNISNGNFSVEQLCSLAGYGRTVFFNKLKSLTGLSPNEYIREVRIKRAAQLLEVAEYTVSQITFMVGMNDSRYFSKCFKQRYNMTPTEYRDKFKQNPPTSTPSA